MLTAWFLCSYRVRGAEGPIPGSRYCAIDDLTKDIWVAGGRWSEAEIDGNQAIVRVRATSTMLSSVGLAHRELSETEARSRWTPTRSKPGWDAVGNQIIFQLAKQDSCKTLDQLVLEVPADPGSVVLHELSSLWASVGFGLGWRLPSEVVQWAMREGLEPDRHGSAIEFIYQLYGLDWARLYEYLLSVQAGWPLFMGGAFPTTGLLDNFNRANEGPPPSTNWTGPVQTGEEGLRVVGNQCDDSTDTAKAGSGVWVGDFGPDSECFSTIAVVPTSTQGQAHFLRVVSPNTAGVDGYLSAYINLVAGIYNSYLSYRLDNNAYTQLGANDALTTLGVGDDVGAEMIGSAIKVYRRVGAGSWTEETTAARTDSTYTAAGRIGLRLDNQPEADDFGGGTVAAAEGHPTMRRWGGIPHMLTGQRGRTW